MRIVTQRASEVSVSTRDTVKSSIQQGFLILLGIDENDTEDDIEWLVKKVVNFHVSGDKQGAMNKSILDVSSSILVVSQFTLMASYKEDNRPFYTRAAGHKISIPLYQLFCERLTAQLGKEVVTSEFGVDMRMKLVNDDPVTICMDTKNKE